MSSFRLQKQKRLLNKIVKLLTHILFLVAVGLLYHLLVNKIGFFNISNIEASGAKTFVNETDLKELVKTRSYGKKILFFNSSSLEKLAGETFQGVQDIKISKKLPRTLVIYVTERIPIAIVYNENSPNQFLVDENGYVLGLIAPGTSNLPKILYDGDIEVGYFLDTKAVSVYFELLKALDKEEVAVSSASIQPDHLLVYLKSPLEVLVDVKKDVYESAHTLSQLIRQLAAQGKTPKRVDLRFNKVVVSYN